MQLVTTYSSETDGSDQKRSSLLIHLLHWIVDVFSLRPAECESVNGHNRLHQKPLTVLKRNLALMATDTAVSECRQGSLDVIVKTNLAKLHSVEMKQNWPN